MSGLNCLFDASPLVMLIFAELYTQAGVARRALFLAYALVCLALFAVLCPLWFVERRAVHAKRLSDKAIELTAIGSHDKLQDNSKDTSTANATAANGQHKAAAALAEPASDGDAAVSVVTFHLMSAEDLDEPIAADQTPAQTAPTESAATSAATSAQNGNGTDKGSSSSPLHGFVDPLADKPLSQQLLSYPFVFGVTFMAIQSSRSIFFVGTVRDWLFNLGDANGTYATIFGVILPLSPVVIPLITWTSSRLSLAQSMHIINAFGLVYGVLCLIKYTLSPSHSVSSLCLSLLSASF